MFESQGLEDYIQVCIKIQRNVLVWEPTSSTFLVLHLALSSECQIFHSTMTLQSSTCLCSSNVMAELKG